MSSSGQDGSGLLAYKKQVFVGYAVAGFVVALVYLWTSVDSPIDTVPNHVAAIFICAMILFVWIGAAIARDLKSVDDAAGPHAHLSSLRRDLPLGLLSLAAMGPIAWLLAAAEVPRLILVPAIAYSYWMRSRAIGDPG